MLLGDSKDGGNCGPWLPLKKQISTKNKKFKMLRPGVRWRWRIILIMDAYWVIIITSTLLIINTCRTHLSTLNTWRWNLLIALTHVHEIYSYLTHIFENYQNKKTSIRRRYNDLLYGFGDIREVKCLKRFIASLLDQRHVRDWERFP